MCSARSLLPRPASGPSRNRPSKSTHGPVSCSPSPTLRSSSVTTASPTAWSGTGASALQQRRTGRRLIARQHDVGEGRVLQPPARRHPRVEQACGLERRLQPTASLRRNTVVEVDQPPQGSAIPVGAVRARPKRRPGSVVAARRRGVRSQSRSRQRLPRPPDVPSPVPSARRRPSGAPAQPSPPVRGPPAGQHSASSNAAAAAWSSNSSSVSSARQVANAAVSAARASSSCCPQAALRANTVSTRAAASRSSLRARSASAVARCESRSSSR